MNKEKPIVISQELWEQTWLGLRARGEGQREAACVWAGEESGGEEQVTAVIFLDDFPGVKSFALQHRTTRSATDALFETLRAKKLSIVADVHTHPEGWVDLSWVDKEHPIEYRPGLCAVVLPDYAMSPPDLQTAGVHVYIGNGQWRYLEAEEAVSKVKIK